jgi:hypothetical protein
MAKLVRFTRDNKITFKQRIIGSMAIMIPKAPIRRLRVITLILINNIIKIQIVARCISRPIVQ